MAERFRQSIEPGHPFQRGEFGGLACPSEGAAGPAQALAARHATETGVAHQALDRAAGHVRSLPSHSGPHFVCPVDLPVRLPDTLHGGARRVVALHTGTAQCRVAPLGSVAPVARWCDLRHLTDRLDTGGQSRRWMRDAQCEMPRPRRRRDVLAMQRCRCGPGFASSLFDHASGWAGLQRVAEQLYSAA